MFIFSEKTFRLIKKYAKVIKNIRKIYNLMLTLIKRFYCIKSFIPKIFKKW